VRADTSLTDSAYFYDPLGDQNGWSFEGDPNGWTANNGGYRTSLEHLDGSYSWYTSGGGDYYMWRYADTSHALNAIKGKKVKFSFSFDPEVTIVNGGFEESDMSSWAIGGSGDHRRAWPWESHHDGSFSMLIGYNYTSPVADSRDWCYQAVTIPATAKNTIFSFWYHMFTEDYEPFNWFEVYIRDSSGNNLERIFYKAGTYPNPGLEEFNWEKVTCNLTKYAGQTIQLNFAVVNNYDTGYKTWCYVDDVMIENEARAEIYYEYTTGDGGGCPYVSTWNGLKYALDDNLMPSSESSTRDVTDYYLLQQSLVANEEGLYSLLLSEFEEEHSFFDNVELLAVDHPPNFNVAVSPCGEILTYTNPHPPMLAITNEHKNVKRSLSSADGDYYEGYNGSYVTLTFRNEGVSQGARLIIRSDILVVKCPIYIQTMDSKGKWQTVATIHTRKYWSTDIVDVSKYLPDARGCFKVRLYFVSNDKIDFVGLDTSPQTTITTQQAKLISAVHSKNSDPTVYGECMESDVKSKLLHSDGAYAELMPYEQIKLAFGFSEAPVNDSVRDFIFVSKGYYRTLPVGTLIDPTVHGYWIAPMAYDWHSVEVVVDLPSITTSVKVIIHGRSDFKAFIDNVMFVIVDTQKVKTDKGTLSVSLNVISWRPLNQTHDEIRAIANLAAFPNGSYRIRSVELQTGLVPSTQNAKLHIEYASQSNDINYVVDPAAVEREQYDTFNSIAFGVGQAVGFGLQLLVIFYGPPPTQLYSGQVKMFASQITSSAVMYALTNTASDPDNKYAGVGTGYSAVWEEWPYPTGPYRDDQNFAFVTVASGNYELIWQFDKGSSDTFQITTTAWVYWGEIYTYSGGLQHDHEFYELKDAGWTSQSLIFTTYA